MADNNQLAISLCDTMAMANNKKQKRGKLMFSSMWALTDSNRRPSACKADALNQLS